MAPDNAGEWYPMRPGSGHVTAIRLGTGQGELSKIRVSSSNPIDGARLYVVVVPVDAGHQVAPPCVNYANDGASVEQPTNPGPGAGANMWFCNMRQFISQARGLGGGGVHAGAARATRLGPRMRCAAGLGPGVPGALLGSARGGASETRNPARV